MLSNLEKKLIKKEEAFCSNNYKPLPVVLKRGKGIYVWDVHSKKYFDFLSAYSAVNQGHCNWKILWAFIKQSTRLTLTSRAFYNSELGDSFEFITKAFGYDKMMPMNSGAEAVETAIKICRKWGHEVKKIKENNAKIIVCNNNFHGRTTTLVSFSSSEKSKKNFGPLTEGFIEIPYNNISALEKILKKNKDVCGFLVEPIQGEGGVVVPENGYLKKCEELCKKHNVLLIADEIQTGICRTGKLLASWHDNVKPDLVILGKALSAGFYPVSGVLSSKEIMSIMKVGSHGSTFGGNPLAVVVSKAAIKYCLDYKLSENAEKLGKVFREELNKIASKRKIVSSVRGKGLLNAIVLDCDVKSDIPWKICLKMKENGLLAKPTQGNKIRFAPPLIITERQLRKAIKIIDTSLVEF
jgi:ornithine--oxo-acid transaminase